MLFCVQVGGCNFSLKLEWLRPRAANSVYSEIMYRSSSKPLSPNCMGDMYLDQSCKSIIGTQVPYKDNGCAWAGRQANPHLSAEHETPFLHSDNVTGKKGPRRGNHESRPNGTGLVCTGTTFQSLRGIGITNLAATFGKVIATSHYCWFWK